MASPLIIKYGYTTLSWTQKEPLVKAGRKLLDKKKRKKRSPPKSRNSIPTVMLPAVRGTKVIDFQLLLTASTDSTTAWIEIHIHFSLELQFAYFALERSIKNLEWSKNQTTMAPTNSTLLEYLDTFQAALNCKHGNLFWEIIVCWILNRF